MLEDRKDINRKRLKKALGTLKKPKRVWYIVRRVASGGMSRTISLFTVVKSEPQCMDLWVHHAEIKGLKLAKDQRGIMVGGAGQNMAYALLDALFRELYGMTLGRWDSSLWSCMD